MSVNRFYLLLLLVLSFNVFGEDPVGGAHSFIEKDLSGFLEESQPPLLESSVFVKVDGDYDIIIQLNGIQFGLSSGVPLSVIVDVGAVLSLSFIDLGGAKKCKFSDDRFTVGREDVFINIECDGSEVASLQANSYSRA